MSSVAAHPAVAILQEGLVEDNGTLRVTAEAVTAHTMAVAALDAGGKREVVAHLIALAKKIQAAGRAGEPFLALLVVLATEAMGDAAAASDAFHHAGVGPSSVLGKTESMRAPAARAIVPPGTPIKAKRGLSKHE